MLSIAMVGGAWRSLAAFSCPSETLMEQAALVCPYTGSLEPGSYCTGSGTQHYPKQYLWSAQSHSCNMTTAALLIMSMAEAGRG